MFVSGVASLLWVQSSDFKSWKFILGVGRVPKGIAADWTIDLAISDSQTATVSTSNWLTKDDVLVHGDHHDALRAEILRALALGRPSEERAEAEVSATSLTLRQPFESEGPDAFAFACTYSANLDSAAIRKRLNLVALPVVTQTSTSLGFGLGAANTYEQDRAEVTIQDGKVEVTAQISSKTSAQRRMASCGLRALVRRIHLVLRSEDPDVRYAGPTAWAP